MAIHTTMRRTNNGNKEIEGRGMLEKNIIESDRDILDSIAII
jgi:hypothetical protein